MFSIISASIAPSFALLSYFYLKDDYDTEPLVEVLRVFFLGTILVFPIMFLQYVFEVEQIFTSNFFKAFITASFLEEFFKWFILFYAVYHLIEFDEHYDGIVYGASLSLGFATVENILYLISNGLEYAIGRAFFPVSSHALFGVIMGYYMGKGKFGEKSEKYECVLLSFLFPFLLHGLYDWILKTERFWLPIMIPFMIFLWWFALTKVKKAKQSIQHFEEEKNQTISH